MTVALTATFVTGCGERSRIDNAARALCDDWSWNEDADLAENAAAMDAVLAKEEVTVEYGHMGRGAREVSFVTERAAKYCDTDFGPYLAALDELDASADAELDEGEPKSYIAPGRSTPKPSPKPTPRPESNNGSGSSGGDGSVATELAEFGYTRSDVVALGLIADDTGYGLSPGTPLPYDMAENFAYVIALSCRDLDRGRTTVGALIDDDVSMGAPPSQAQRFWSYVTSRFCR
ncbi:hypothetical protein [Nocardioides ginkgobilobae]